MPRIPGPESTLEAGELATVTVVERDGVTVASISGEVDISNVEVVAEILDRLPNQAVGLVIDLSVTSYLDSAAISLLHSLATRLGQRGQRMAIVCGERSLPHRVLTLTDVHSRTPVLDHVEQAVRSVRDEPE